MNAAHHAVLDHRVLELIGVPILDRSCDRVALGRNVEKIERSVGEMRIRPVIVTIGRPSSRRSERERIAESPRRLIPSAVDAGHEGEAGRNGIIARNETGHLLLLQDERDDRIDVVHGFPKVDTNVLALSGSFLPNRRGADADGRGRDRHARRDPEMAPRKGSRPMNVTLRRHPGRAPEVAHERRELGVHIAVG